MEECEAPSFSLGFDLDLDSPNHDPTNLIVPDSESDPDTRPEPPRRILKRLRRGPPSSSSSVHRRYEPPPSFVDDVVVVDDDDDDIEEFSSQDEPLQVSAHSSGRNRSVCSSSKVSLKGAGILIPHSSTNSREKKRKQDSEIPDSVGLETGRSGSVFRRIAASPLRKFPSIDSDDDMVDEVVNGDNKLDPALSTGPILNRNKPLTPLEQDSKTQFAGGVNRNQEDLWKNLSPMKNVSIPRDIQASAGLETGHSGSVFPNPKSAASPLRKIQLLDSDSDDDDLVIEDVRCTNKLGPSSTGNRNKPVSSLKQDKKVRFADVNQNQKHLSPVKKNFSIPTPAFNDVCDEYFRSAKNTQAPKSNHNETSHGVNSGGQKDEEIWEAAGPCPPAHHYFFHEDSRTQQLVRSRLCNFTPLGVNTADEQQNIDYMGQFDNGGSTSRRSKSKNVNGSEEWVDPKIISSSSSRKKATKRNNTKSSASKSKNNETSNLNSSDVSANWVEPKDAGQRRVQASDQSAGHWYTGSDGRKVYVDKSGKELTGRNAYRLYRKESGTEVKKSKKKAIAKKSTAKKGK